MDASAGRRSGETFVDPLNEATTSLCFRDVIGARQCQSLVDAHSLNRSRMRGLSTRLTPGDKPLHRSWPDARHRRLEAGQAHACTRVTNAAINRCPVKIDRALRQASAGEAGPNDRLAISGGAVRRRGPLKPIFCSHIRLAPVRRADPCDPRVADNVVSLARTSWWATQGSNQRPLPCEGNALR